ncbi:MAG: helix-turn-helix transcriptional regulator [Fibrobacteres bacterium]|nr:helix-turn-helix transcriptional regulator [Fibrobacterota bacterium]
MKKFTWPAELTLSLIGGKWKGLILNLLLTGESKRFGELKKLSRGISAKILAKHLKELEFDGLITRMVTGTDKPRILYAPTERSRSLAPVLTAMQLWGQEHLDVYADNEPGDGPARGDATGPLPEGSIREPSFRAAKTDFRADQTEESARPIPDIALVS